MAAGEELLRGHRDQSRGRLGAVHCLGLRARADRAQESTQPILDRYQRHLFLYRKKDGQPLSSRSRQARTTPVRAFFKWLARHNHILYNPASELEMPRMERRSTLITANQPFGEWGKVFPDPAMTLAAVDRLVHHATIFEMNVDSYRARTALQRKQQGTGRPATFATQKRRIPVTQRQSTRDLRIAYES